MDQDEVIINDILVTVTLKIKTINIFYQYQLNYTKNPKQNMSPASDICIRSDILVTHHTNALHSQHTQNQYNTVDATPLKNSNCK